MLFNDSLIITTFRTRFASTEDMAIISFKYIMMLLSGIFGQAQQEPVCTRLHYEEMVLKRMGNLELMVEEIRGEVGNLELMVGEIRGKVALEREIKRC